MASRTVPTSPTCSRSRSRSSTTCMRRLPPPASAPRSPGTAGSGPSSRPPTTRARQLRNRRLSASSSCASWPRTGDLQLAARDSILDPSRPSTPACAGSWPRPAGSRRPAGAADRGARRRPLDDARARIADGGSFDLIDVLTFSRARHRRAACLGQRPRLAATVEPGDRPCTRSIGPPSRRLRPMRHAASSPPSSPTRHHRRPPREDLLTDLVRPPDDGGDRDRLDARAHRDRSCSSTPGTRPASTASGTGCTLPRPRTGR